MLEALGVSLTLTPEQIADCIESVGVGFMFAPAHHGAMKYAVGPRKELGMRTLFNVLGPLTNPARVSGRYWASTMRHSANRWRRRFSNWAVPCAGASQ